MLDWPRTLSGAKKKDNHELPLLHPIMDFLTDKNHQVHTYARYFFVLSQRKQSLTCCTSNDTQRMKRSFAYFIHMFWHKLINKFKKGAKALLDHHFNNHEFCGDWCPAKKWKDTRWEKIEGAEIPMQIETCNSMQPNVSNPHYLHWHLEPMRDLSGVPFEQVWESQRFHYKILPKFKHYCCRTIVSKAQTNVAIGIDLLGHEKYFSVLFEMLGLPKTVLTTEHHERIDRGSKMKLKYRMTSLMKQRREERKNWTKSWKLRQSCW